MNPGPTLWTSSILWACHALTVDTKARCYFFHTICPSILHSLYQINSREFMGLPSLCLITEIQKMSSEEKKWDLSFLSREVISIFRRSKLSSLPKLRRKVTWFGITGLPGAHNQAEAGLDPFPCSSFLAPWARKKRWPYLLTVTELSASGERIGGWDKTIWA